MTRPSAMRRIASPIGTLGLAACPEGVREVRFDAPEGVVRGEDRAARCAASEAMLDRLARWLDAYFAGGTIEEAPPLAPEGTAFQRAVWGALLAIPHGATRSYAQIARAIGRPTAVRAVARANATNPIAILIPCHRVIGADGSLTGYGGGLDRKKWLLDHEQRCWGGAATLFAPAAA